MLEKSILLYKRYLILFSLLFFSIYCEEDCWVKFDAKEHFALLDEIDERYSDARYNFQAAAGGNKFDKDMLVVMLKTRGIAERALHRAEGDHSQIPAGINLGGSSMLRLPKALLFFHRMKLRNNTQFRVVDLQSNLTTLELRANLLLNDLHLFGSYDISHTMDDSSQLLYYPSFGEVQFLLKNVSYKIDGHYRLLHNRLNLELVRSDISVDRVLMMYNDQNSTNSINLESKNIDSFIERLKVDLDKWIKDYFNDYLAYFVVAEDKEFEKYNQEKTAALNEYADNVIDTIKKKLNKIHANAVHLPTFTIKTENGADIRLREGVLRGLDSIYKRSIATGSREDKVRHVDAIVGFSNLKLQYRYDTLPQSGMPPVTGILTLTADDLTALMDLEMIKDPETSDISFKYLEQTKPESLTVEGSANRLISNFKYILERHVIAIMTNSLMHNINMLGTLDRCVPLLAAYKEPNDKDTNIDYSSEHKNNINVDESEKTQTKKSKEADDEANLNHSKEAEENRNTEKIPTSQEANEIKRNSDNSLHSGEDTTKDTNNRVLAEDESNSDKSKEKTYLRRGRKSRGLKKRKKIIHRRPKNRVKQNKKN